MSNIMDRVDQALAERVRKEREGRRWSLAELAIHSGVSKAMLSKIERVEASPTANTLARIATAFGLTLAELLSFERASSPTRLMRADAQPTWRDPETNYVRRQIFAEPYVAFEMVEIILPAGKSVSFPASTYIDRQHVVWMLSGELNLREGDEEHFLSTGDRLQFREPKDVTYRNDTLEPCRYLVAILLR